MHGKRIRHLESRGTDILLAEVTGYRYRRYSRMRRQHQRSAHCNNGNETCNARYAGLNKPHNDGYGWAAGNQVMGFAPCVSMLQAMAMLMTLPMAIGCCPITTHLCLFGNSKRELSTMLNTRLMHCLAHLIFVIFGTPPYFFGPVKSTPKKCVNSRQKLHYDKRAKMFSA